MEGREADVVVIGAGISGLCAAQKLLNKDPNLDVIVLEAKDRVGGRTLTVELASKNGTDMWDLGGQWVGNCQPHIMTLLQELSIETYPQYITGKKFMQAGPKNKISSYKSDIPTLSLMGIFSLHRILRSTDKLSSEIDPVEPFACPKAEKWDSQTLETFIDSHFWISADAKDLIRSAMRTMFGAELSQMSLLFFLTYVASAGQMKLLLEATQGTAQEFKIKGGSQQISQKLAEKVGTDRICLGEPVATVQQTEDTVIVTTKTGKTFQCKRLILAVPPSQIGKISFSPELPVENREIAKRMPPSNIIKFIVTYTECFWRDSGCSGEVVSNGGSSLVADCKMGPVGVVYDATSSNNQPALLGFIGGLQAVLWQKQKEDVRRKAVIESLVAFFGDKASSFLEYREKIWDLEPYNDGAPVSIVGPGAMRYYSRGLRIPFDKVYFAGTESATIWCGFMNGAVQAGHRAAIEILFDLRPQLVNASDIQSVSRQRKLRKRSSKRKKIIKLSLGIGACMVLVMGARKIFQLSMGSS